MNVPAPVVLVTFADPDGTGGVPRTLRVLRDGLRARGRDVTTLSSPLVVTRTHPLVRRVWRRIDHSSEEVHRIRRSLDDLSRQVRESPADAVCIAFEAWTAAVCAEAGRATIHRVAGVGSITDEWLRNGFVARGSRRVPWLRARERTGYEAARRTVVLGTAGARAIEGLGARPGTVVPIPNGVDLPELPPPRSGADPLTIVCTANLRRVKGVDILAAALAVLPETTRARVRLVHFGGGRDAGNPTYETAAARLAEAGIDHEFRGARPNTEVREALLRADLFALPSRMEMFSNALLEAMAAGLPAVGTDVGGVPEILGDAAREDGLVVPPEDPGALSRALARLIDEPELRRRHGASNRRRVESEFSLERVVDRYDAVVADVARDG